MLNALKKEVRRQLGAKRETILISSMGRTGSTVVFDAVRKSVGQARLPAKPALGVRLVSSQAWDLTTTSLLPGIVYKTHDFPGSLVDSMAAKPLRAVFCFGKASAAALSVLSCPKRYGDDWVRRHLEHLRADGTLKDLRSRDALRFEEQVDDWFAEERFPVLRVKYESLWDNPDILTEFVGVPVALPVQKARTAKYFDPEIRADIQSTFAALDARIGSLPDVSLNGAAQR